MTDKDWALALYEAARVLRSAWSDMSSADAIFAAFDKARGVTPIDYELAKPDYHALSLLAKEAQHG